MSESPCNERRLEILGASCTGQPREMVNLFLAPMKRLSTSEWFEKALDRLRQRYGVSGRLTTEPQLIDIRHGSKVAFNVSSLKSFNKDLNNLEVFAYAHDEVGKLSGQLLLDVARRLPGVLKRRYLDYLAQMKLNLNRPGFDQGWKPGYLALGCQFQFWCVETQMSGFSFGLVSRLLKNRFQFRFQFCLCTASVSV